jgi:cephalosporin hydroxylase
MDFARRRLEIAERNWSNEVLRRAAQTWHDESRRHDYQYMFEFCGLPIIQDPQDICMLQEVLWAHDPTVVIETGVARGGSLVLSATMVAAREFSAQLAGSPTSRRLVCGIDIDIRQHNRIAIEQHPLSPLIELIEGSSIDPHVISQVRRLIRADDRVLVILDSDHSAAHVLEELKAYAPMVNPRGAILVMDTGIEFAPPDSFSTDRPWGPGSNPYTAVQQFLQTQDGEEFVVEDHIQKRHLITSAPSGYLVRRPL